ncbi:MULTISPECIES: hypothetical protein [Sorangium]|uniref:hypothetical protein n=1 Tax=Sorangium TaxID=39643 RepID=UPI00101A2152|nr:MULTISPECIES: hypothetical protein [Sorangium]
MAQKRGAAAGVQRGDATGGSGFVTVSASGGFIAEDVEIRHKKMKLRFKCPGAARRPNAAQLALAEASLEAQFPGDEGIFLGQLLGQAVSVVLRVTWAMKTSVEPR